MLIFEKDKKIGSKWKINIKLEKNEECAFEWIQFSYLLEKIVY
jgi:hypothetical protein